MYHLAFFVGGMNAGRLSSFRAARLIKLLSDYIERKDTVSNVLNFMLFAVCGHSFADYTLALEGAFLGLLIELYHFLIMGCSGRILEDVGQLLCVEVSGWLMSFWALGCYAK